MNFGSCGRWRNGRLVNHCTMAGTEECDFECPYRDDEPDVGINGLTEAETNATASVFGLSSPPSPLGDTPDQQEQKR